MDTDLNELDFGWFFVLVFWDCAEPLPSSCHRQISTHGAAALWTLELLLQTPECRVQDPELRDVFVEPPSDFLLLGFNPS